MKKVSIVIPIYNSSKTLKRCLNSVIEQTYKNIEIICVNDASNDDSVEIIKEYQNNDKRIVFINQKKNSGPAITKNNGMLNSTGDYVSFVDSDDYICKDMISKMVEFMEKDKLDIVRCHYNNYVGDHLISRNLNFKTGILDKRKKEQFIISLIDGTVPAYMQLIMINKKSINLKEIPIGDKYYLEDLLFYIRLLNVTDKVGIINEPLYNYVDNLDGLTFSMSKEKIKKRIDGLLYYNNESKKILDSKYNDIINNRTTYLLIHFLYQLYYISVNNKKSIIELVNDNKISCIMNDSIVDNYELFIKKSYKYITLKKYRLLFVWFFITKKYLNMKRKLKK